MTAPWPVYCETTELASEVATLAATLGLSLEPLLTGAPLDAAARAVAQSEVAICVCLSLPEPMDLLAAAELAGERRGRLIVSLIARDDRDLNGLALDLGLPCVQDLAPALACARLLSLSPDAFRISARKLNATDRARLERFIEPSERGPGRLVAIESGNIAFRASERATPVPLGSSLGVGPALAALQRSLALAPIPAHQTNPARTSSNEVLFGPRRLLSDPSSKAALAPYGLPMPIEELCASPSRAASEAARIGFPVRISLASPDLRVWDHPDLCVDGVDNAARVKDVYRQLTLVAAHRAPDARVLGVTVTATTLSRALLRVRARPAGSRVLIRLGFADPHGEVARDAVLTALPTSAQAFERSLGRLSGSPLILSGQEKEREADLQTLFALVSQVGAFLEDFRTEVERIDLNPIALQVGGGAEIREAAIQVTDAYTKGLGEPLNSPG